MWKESFRQTGCYLSKCICNIQKTFQQNQRVLKIVKVPHLKRIPKHEPTLSFFHLVQCLRKCIMRSGENNQHVQNGYGKEMAPSSDVNDTDEDKDEGESNNSIVHDLFDEPSAENLIMEESDSECNIVNETSSQSDSSNVTTELNYDDHIKPSYYVKESSYFNIFECGRNLLDKLDVTYQSAFAASKKPSTRSSVPPPAAYVSPLKKNIGMCRQTIIKKIWPE